MDAGCWMLDAERTDTLHSIPLCVGDDLRLTTCSLIMTLCLYARFFFVLWNTLLTR